MNYIVFDLEFNQGFNFGKEKAVVSKPGCPFEIIHLGAVKLDKNLRNVGDFNHLVKPKLYTRLHPFVKKMTRISKADLKAAKPFKEVYEEFVDFMGKDAVLCVWGTSDIKELIKNVEYHKLDTSTVPDRFIDVQHYANKHLDQPKNASIGLGNAVAQLDIPQEMDFHNAFNDAWYTAEVFKKIYNETIEASHYSMLKSKPAGGTWKTNLDIDKLIRHFEKTFNREMTDEEKGMIKLAYKTGYLKQFQKAVKPSDK